MAFDFPARRLRCSLADWLGALRCVGLSAGLFACGGLAADGPVAEADSPGATSPGSVTGVDGPSRGTPVRETCEDNPSLAGCPGAAPALVRPIRETCEDNPLLAGCPGDDSLPTPAPRPPSQEAIPKEESYIARALNILASHCGGCHGSSLTQSQAAGGINYIDDWDQMIRAGLIDECSPESSRIVDVMISGEMPPAGPGSVSVSVVDIDTVVTAIDIQCPG
jgi:mono/diheme cytochrome c family protein